MKLLVFLIIFSTSLHAEILYRGVNISPLVEHYRSQVVVTDRAFTTYNWSEQKTGFLAWLKHFTKSELAQNNPRYVDLVKNYADTFWIKFGSPEGKQNLYGFGLYTAEDPARTILYGGFNSDWRLIQIQFPVGTRLLDFPNLQRDLRDVHSEETKNILRQFDCNDQFSAQSLFEDGGAYLHTTCRNLVYEVFNNILHVDLLGYDYYATRYADCPSLRGGGIRAFVVLSNGWMNSENVHVYNADSKVNLEERIRIQTLISKAETDKVAPDWKIYFKAIMDYQHDHPGYVVRGFQTLCDDLMCESTAKFCALKSLGECQTATFARFARRDSVKIDRRELRTSKVLWEDVVGKRKAPDISQWLLQNHFDCGGKLPYTTTGD